MNNGLRIAAATLALLLGVATAHAQNAASEDGAKEKQVFRIAGGAPNRIVTPYDSAKIVTNVKHEAWAVGGVLYLLPMAEEHTIAGFIQDESGRWAIPVIFEVARIPPQEVRLADPDYQPLEPEVDGGGRGVAKSGSGNAHVDRIVDALVGAINQENVPGFRQMPNHAGGVVYVGPIRMELEHVQQRGDVRIERHRIEHEGMEPRPVSEASFEVPNRLGVVVYPPMTEIEPGQEAHVYIARRASRE